MSLDSRKGVVGEKALLLLVISYCIIERFDRDITCWIFQSILDILDAHLILDVRDVWDHSFKRAERHSDELEFQKIKVDMVELKEVSRSQKMEAMDIDYVAEVNDAHGGRKCGARRSTRLTKCDKVGNCDRA